MNWLSILPAIPLSVVLMLTSGQGIGAQPLGVLFPLTGGTASYGVKGREGVQFAIEVLNDAQSCGHNVRLRAIFEDSAANPQTGLSAFQKLVSVDHVPVVIGDIVSSVTLAVAPLANRTETVLLSPTASAPAITNAGPYVYRIWPSDIEEGRAIARYAINHGFKRAAILYMNNDYGLDIEKIFSNTFVGDKRAIVYSESYLETDQDFRTALAKLKSMNPDVLYVAGYYADSGTIVRQARELGIKIPILGTTAIDDSKFLELAGRAAEGVVFPLATGYDSSSTAPQVVSFVDGFKNQFGEIPGWIEAQAYDAVGVVCAAVKKIAGPVTGEQLKTAFDETGIFTGVTGSFRFDKHGDVVKPIQLWVVKDGKFVKLAP